MKKHGPDLMERGVHLGCGLFFGIFVGLLVAPRLLRRGLLPGYLPEGYELLEGIILVALVCGVLSMIFGDRFWDKFKG